MASSSRTSSESGDRKKEQRKRPLLRSNDQVEGASEAKKSKTPPKPDADWKAAKGEPKSAGRGGGGGRSANVRQEKEQQAVKRKRPLRTAAAIARSRSSSHADERAEDPSPVALLDMLAEVASATLKNDPSIRTQLRKRRRSRMNNRTNMRQTRSSSSAAKRGGNSSLPSAKTSKPQRRSTQPEQLSLDQIRMLSDKLLLNMFAEMTADEIRRNYTYSCYLLPDKCLQKYTSFGNENRARMQMKTHLLGHIAELLSEANAGGRSSQKGKFTAEPVTARKRRLAVEQESVRSSKRRGGGGMRKAQVTVATSNSKTTGSGTSKLAAKVKSQVAKKAKPSDCRYDSEPDGEEAAEDPTPKRNKAKPLSKDWSANGVVTKGKVVKETATSKAVSVLVEKQNLKEESFEPHEDEKPICYDQPMHDHCYTTVDGGKNFPDHHDYDEDCENGSDYGEYDEEEDDDGETDVKVTLEPDLRKGLVVFTQFDEAASGAIEAAQATFRSKQAEMALRQLEAIRLLQMQKTRKVTVPLPTKIYTKASAEDCEKIYADDDVADYAPLQMDARPNLRELEDELMDLDSEKQALDKGSPEWERRLALKCIRMLRTKKKDEHVPLVCKICKGKSFTAQATLMYHYRSHAGIKPFLCNICNTTFTRQHSLNYHMLIHNNKSRFTCGDCGRKFRHPSHFKEHMRRHTGETPFECSDCGVRFKTRNTYKRHLKTRHGKLLTVNGIMMLSTEEFLKVKTNPKKRQLRLKKDKETQWPEAIMPATSLNLKSIAVSNIPLMADIESGLYLQSENCLPVRVQVMAEPSTQDLSENIREMTPNNFMEEEEEAATKDDQEGGGLRRESVSDTNSQFTCISIGVGTDGQNAEQNIIILEALPIESPKQTETEDGSQIGDETQWPIDESFGNQSEAIEAAVVLQPYLQCM